MRIERKETYSFPIQLFVTGDPIEIEQACQDYCDSIGLCVTVTKTNYIFKGGNEEGFIIGLINYPRFPKTMLDLFLIAEDLGKHLIETCNPEGSFTLQDNEKTFFYSNRPND
jgi:hypothetical protein